MIPPLRALRRLSLAAPFAALASCNAGLEQRAVSPGDLPPIRTDYRTAILDWARGFYAEPSSLRETAISDPLLIRDASGRLLWLVCVEANARYRGGSYMGIQRQAFGFASNYVSAPQDRNRAALTREECDDPRLAYRPFPALGRL